MWLIPATAQIALFGRSLRLTSFSVSETKRYYVLGFKSEFGTLKAEAGLHMRRGVPRCDAIRAKTAGASMTSMGAQHVRTVGLDLGQRRFRIYGMEDWKDLVVNLRLPRFRVASFFGGLPRCRISMESRGAAAIRLWPGACAGTRLTTGSRPFTDAAVETCAPKSLTTSTVNSGWKAQAE